jgi:hypothetical protein
MRQRFNMDIASLDDLMCLIHGPFGSGKTHLQGDFLRWAKERGPVMFLNIPGEDGTSSVAGMGLGEVGETVTSIKDYDEALNDYAKAKLAGLAVDSMSAFYRLILKDLLGEVRYPDPKLDGERAKMLWGQISMKIAGRIAASRSAARHVLWVSPFDRSDDSVGGGKGITPDLPGKLAYGCAGWFDFVGYLTAETLGPTKITRKVTFAPATNILTRQRIPRPITEAINIPEGGGGWAAIYAAMSAALPKEAK